MLFGRVCSRLLQGVSELQNAVLVAGFGFPYACAQSPSRVESSALFVAELLISHVDGWPRIAKQSNHAQYRMSQQLLGFRAGDCLGHVRHVCDMLRAGLEQVWDICWTCFRHGVRHVWDMCETCLGQACLGFI